jgi:transposase-like protein
MYRHLDVLVPRPTHCPYCKGTIIDTLAKIITPSTFWRCLNCQRTWTIASLEAVAARRV